VDQNSFSNLGQVAQIIFAGISAVCGVLALIRPIPKQYRLWIKGIGIVTLPAIVRLVFSAWLRQPLFDVCWGVMAIGTAYVVGYLSAPPTVAVPAVPAVAATPVAAAPSAEKPWDIEVLLVRFHVSRDKDVTYKKKLLILLRNKGQHDILVGPKASWVPGEISVYRLDELVWELEPAQGWESDGWKWQPAESTQQYVSQGMAFRTWIALHENATEAEVERLRLRGRLGTLRIPLKVKVGNYQISI
jgi:hypothetical protein